MKKGYCMVSASPVRAEKKDSSEMLTQLLFGELVEIESTDGAWSRILTFSDNYWGYVDSKHLRLLSDKEANRWMDGLSFQTQITTQINTPWGKQTIFRGSFIPSDTSNFNIGNDQFSFVEENEPVHFQHPFHAALTYLNTPYLWGGKTPFGIDCSGLTQTAMRFFGINLPRDAYQQAEHGETINYSDCAQNDLAFFRNQAGKITHVGIIDGKGSIIHASGRVRKDELTPDGIRNSETNEITHQLAHIKRL